MSLDNALTYKLSPLETKLKVRISGEIDRSFSDFTDRLMANSSNFKSILFDLNEVTRINSNGIVMWIKMMLMLKGIRTEFENCPICIVQQANMIGGFFNSNSCIVSFYVGYYNESQNKELQVLYSLGPDYGHQYLNIKSTVTENNIDYNIDVSVEKYFSFLQNLSMV